jgi:cytochrome c oxidase subunit 2
MLFAPEAAADAVQKMPAIRVDGGWMPIQASTFAPEVDRGWNYAMIVSVVTFAIVIVAMFYFMFRYRRRKENERTEEMDHSTKLEIAWSVIPLGVVIWLFFVGLRGYVDASIPPRDAYTINVQAYKWGWNFNYTEGFTSGDLVVPKGRPVRLVLSSQDVLHSFFIPEFRVKQDVVPGQYLTLWFEATVTGETLIECTEYCGTNHSNMLRKVVVLEETDFRNWLELQGKDKPLEELGPQLYVERACKGCHSIDGAVMPGGGPSFKGLFGKQEAMADGSTVTVDEAYLKESILNSQAKIVKGYQAGIMPSYTGQLKDREVDALVAFIKAQK